MGKLIPKKKLLRKKKLLLKPKKVAKKIEMQEPYMVDGSLVLNQGRLFHYGHRLRTMATLGGFQYTRIKKDLTLEVFFWDGSKKDISPIVLCTRDGRYAFKYIENILSGRNTDNLEFEMDQFDYELAKVLKGEK
jgi:hypothetical protein